MGYRIVQCLGVVLYKLLYNCKNVEVSNDIQCEMYEVVFLLVCNNILPYSLCIIHYHNYLTGMCTTTRVGGTCARIDRREANLATYIESEWNCICYRINIVYVYNIK
jgi:hypothetical protein